MAKKKAQKIEARDQDEDEEGVENTPAPPSELDIVLSELGAGDDAKIVVNKLGKAGETRCKTYPPAEFARLDEVLRTEFGAGVYYLYVREGAHLKKKIKLELAEMVAGAEPRQAVTQQHDEGGVMLRDLLAQQSQMQREMLAELRGVVTNMAQSAPAAKQEMRETLLLLKELMPAAREEGGGIDTFLRGMTMGQKLASGGGESGLADVAVRVLDLIAPTLAHRGAAAVSALPEGVGEGVDMLGVVRRLVAPHLRLLIAAAARESDPGAYAQVVLDQVPDQYISLLQAQLSREDWWQVLVGISPELAQHQAWFTDFRRHVLEAFDDAQSEPPAAS